MVAAETFSTDSWRREEGGGGITRTFAGGNLIEKGGVAFSAVTGPYTPVMQQTLKIDAPEGTEFLATGVSIVLHPRSPLMPIIHMNVRYFSLTNDIWWFGGGIDLTPHYVTADSGRFIHQTLKDICDKYDFEYYPRFKQWADDYFFIPHRNETRGVGGIFFDRLSATDNHTKADRWGFVQDVALSFVPIYKHYAEQYRHLPYGERETEWQMRRRSRYVEFNLVYDLGTKFGLISNGRTESILMSMPPLARWDYGYAPPPNSPEAETLTWLRKAVDWVKG